jgi:hypothetical protein
MSLRIAADNVPTLPVGEMENFVVVREYDEGRDKVAVEEMERSCEVGQRGKHSLVTDLMGDPICRVRRFPSHVMLVSSNSSILISPTSFFPFYMTLKFVKRETYTNYSLLHDHIICRSRFKQQKSSLNVCVT